MRKARRVDVAPKGTYLTRALIDALLAATPQVPYSKTLIGDDQVKVEIAPPAGSRPASGCSDGDADVPAAPAREAVPSGAEY